MYLTFIVPLLLVQVHAEQCATPSNEPGECVLLTSCTVLYEALQGKPETYVEEFVQESICGGTKFIPKVCCATSSNFTIPKPKISKPESVTKNNVLPGRKYCGYQHSDDYFRAENDTSIRINEFPWLARIIYILDNANPIKIFVLCAGSLINTRYVLTSGYCVNELLHPVVGVRLGEYAPWNKTDCIKEPPYEEECSGFEDFAIEKIIRHPNYSKVDESDDIALIRLNRTVIYTDYIRPICLPSLATVRANFGDILTTSGWGFHDSVRDQKKKILSKLVTQEECTRSYYLNFYNSSIRINENHICTVQGSNDKETCLSDFGGPVMFSYNFQWHQEAIVHSSVSCQRKGVPEVHTNLTNYLDWIKNSLEA